MTDENISEHEHEELHYHHIGTPVLSAKQGQELVGTRMHLILQNFEAAVEHLHTCATFSGIASWASAAEAAEFWGKMRDDERAIIAARDFRAHCYREYGLLAQRLRPQRSRKKGPGGGSFPGPNSWLCEHGAKRGDAVTAITLANLSESDFRSRLGKGQAPATVAQKYGVFQDLSKALSTVVFVSRAHTAASAAKAATEHRRSNTLGRLDEAIEWLCAVRSELLRLTSIEAKEKSDD